MEPNPTPMRLDNKGDAQQGGGGNWGHGAPRCLTVAGFTSLVNGVLDRKTGDAL